MGWLSLSGGSQNSSYNSNSNTNFSGTHTPILSPQWTGSFGGASGNVNPNGMTPTQTTAATYFGGVLGGGYTNPSWYGGSNPISSSNNATSVFNGVLGARNSDYADVNQYGLAPLFTNQAPSMTAASSGAVPQVSAQTGASMAAPYGALYDQSLINPSLSAYDYGTDRAFSALDARTAGAGAFGNTRSGLGYSDLGAQSSLGRGQLAAGLLTTGLTNAINAGQTDASRNLAGQTTNAANTMGNNQFNANLTQQASLANLQAQEEQNQQRLAAAQQWAGNVSSMIGVSQQQLNNIVSANGNQINVDMNAAQQLLNTGQITQSQLVQLVNLAQAANGQSTSGTSSTVSSGTGSATGMKGEFTPQSLFGLLG